MFLIKLAKSLTSATPSVGMSIGAELHTSFTKSCHPHAPNPYNFRLTIRHLPTRQMQYEVEIYNKIEKSFNKYATSYRKR